MSNPGRQHKRAPNPRAHMTPELIANAAASEAMRSYEKVLASNPHLRPTKEAFFDYTSAMIDKIVEAKGLDILDTPRAKCQAQVIVETMFDRKCSK
ncbi:hypothetical protein BGX31_005460 [Mortierella sp. GBA43]|nr:hypothetical protein BGX31_005460 [Mortierella sp. GBA43]